jgi:hypothetical protein
MASPIDLSKLETLVKSLNDSLDTVGTRLALATAAVVIGLLIEYEEHAREVFWALIDGIRNQNLNSFRTLESHVKRAVLGGIFITVGVGAELCYEHRTSVIDGALQSANGQIVAFLNGKARDTELATQGLKTEADTARTQAEGFKAQIADANARAKNAEAEVASAKQAAAEAQSLARSAELERVELAARIAPRTLTLAQRISLGSALSVFSASLKGRAVRFEWQSIDIEATIFGVELKDCLTRAGIQSDGPTELTLGVGYHIILGLAIKGPVNDGFFELGLGSLLKTAFPREELTVESDPKYNGSPVTVTVGFKTPQGLDTLPGARERPQK